MSSKQAKHIQIRYFKLIDDIRNRIFSRLHASYTLRICFESMKLHKAEYPSSHHGLVLGTEMHGGPAYQGQPPARRPPYWVSRLLTMHSSLRCSRQPTTGTPSKSAARAASLYPKDAPVSWIATNSTFDARYLLIPRRSQRAFFAALVRARIGLRKYVRHGPAVV
mmetsp:Transcript_27915/g.83653  ORF Transcript_27915/g.83653 Transcript_27915/m.83653 type:complete len:165 (+) Transcript_27915:185-679(+)